MDLSVIIVASIGLLASVITASLSYYFTKKHQLKMEERRLKEEFYRSFIKAVNDAAIDNEDDDAQRRFAEGFNSLLLIANANVVIKLKEFHSFIAESEIPRGSEEHMMKFNDLLTKLIKEMRYDLFGRKNINKNYPEVYRAGKP